MSKLRVLCFSVSIDGFGAGPDQSLANPLGRGGEGLHQWMYPTRTFQAMIGHAGGTAGIDDDIARRSMEGIGAWILGRCGRGSWTSCTSRSVPWCSGRVRRFSVESTPLRSVSAAPST